MEKSLEKFKNLMISLQINQRIFREIINELNEQNIRKQFELIIDDNERVINELKNTFRQKIGSNNICVINDLDADNNGTEEVIQSITNDSKRKKTVSTNRRTSDGTDSAKTYRCQWPGCGYETEFGANLDRHSCVHSGEKPYVCDWPQCQKRYKQSNSLLTHKRSHFGLKPYACHWIGCDYRTNNRCSLPAHQRAHNGVKPFPCDRCPLRCSTKSHLREHRLTHTRDKSFKCDVCDQSFSKKYNMRAHKMSVHLGVKRIRNKTNAELNSNQSHNH